jgi:hypothetical protein
MYVVGRNNVGLKASHKLLLPRCMHNLNRMSEEPACGLPFKDTAPSRPKTERDNLFRTMSGASTTWTMSLVLNTRRPRGVR